MKNIIEFIKEKYKLIIISCVVLIIVGIVAYTFFTTKKSNNKTDVVAVATPNIKTQKNKDENKKTANKFKVDIKGAVENPGVYELDEGSIINDVINIAGGLKYYATTKNINLSRKIEDEMVIIIYSQNDLNDMLTKVSNDCKTTSADITTCIDEKKSVVTSGKSNSSKASSPVAGNNADQTEESKIVSINNATKEELMSLNGIGESKADNIIKYREENGGFKSIEEIMNISGIGETVFAKIKDYITI